MANRRFQAKGQQMANEFIYIDLLPDMRRPRQFNVNILLVVLFAVILSWIFIYFPLSARQARLDAALELNNDLQFQLLLVNEELVGLNIQQNRVNFLRVVERVEHHQIDYQDYFLLIEELIESYDGRVRFVRYSAVNQQFDIIVELNTAIESRSLNWDFIDLPFVRNSSNTTPSITQNFTYTAVFTIEVTLDVE